MSNWIGEPRRLIVAAACRYVDGPQQVVFVGVRHFDPIMRQQMDTCALDLDKSLFEQGFIDNCYTFLDRKEALQVATAAGQINQHRSKTSPEDELFSEDLY